MYVYMYVCMYIYIYMYICMYVYIHIHSSYVLRRFEMLTIRKYMTLQEIHEKVSGHQMSLCVFSLSITSDSL